MKKLNDLFHSLLNACASGIYGVPADQEQAALLRQIRAHLREVLRLDGDDLRGRERRFSSWPISLPRSVLMMRILSYYLIINFELPLKSRHRIQAVNGGSDLLVLILF